ncbi:hypothetical protein [Clostridium paraputrificum]|uniref:hypothetical protein n=1 Tax=Clostridium paraputrificum TaxID=29363 RepID=UPI003F60B06E
MMVVLIIGIYLLIVLLFIHLFKGANKVYKNSITLNPIDFKKSKIGQPTLFHEFNKCKEEDDEFQRVVLKNDVDNAIEEFHDSIQTKLNCLDMLNIPIKVICMDQYKHYRKLEERGFIFKELEE